MHAQASIAGSTFSDDQARQKLLWFWDCMELHASTHEGRIPKQAKDMAQDVADLMGQAWDHLWHSPGDLSWQGPLQVQLLITLAACTGRAQRTAWGRWALHCLHFVLCRCQIQH